MSTPSDRPSRETIAFLGVSRLRGVGFQVMRKLGDASALLQLLDQASPDAFQAALTQAGARPPLHEEAAAAWDDMRRRIWQLGTEAADSLARRRISLLFAGTAGFPPAFTAMPEDLQPRWIFVRGKLDLLSSASVAVVGTRSTTETGEFLARYAVSCAREADATVVSGLAKGIDRVAHEWALNVGAPTVSVLGSGILVPYPARHADLADAIVDAGGTVISEYLPDQPPSADTFVWRNRLQAALSQVVLPAEWKARSGTAHTVRFAQRLGRPVYGLELLGARKPPDAGVPERRFAVPSDHQEFVDALEMALQRDVTEPQAAAAAQIDLFGDQ